MTLGFGRWDCHGKNFGQCREQLPKLDQGLSALVDDLHERGLDKDVSVVVWGEFGRTPQDQQGRRPRPLAAGHAAPCSPAAGCGPARSSARPTDWPTSPKDRPVTLPGRLRHALPQPRASTRATAVPDRAGRPDVPARRARADPRTDLTAFARYDGCRPNPGRSAKSRGGSARISLQLAEPRPRDSRFRGRPRPGAWSSGGSAPGPWAVVPWRWESYWLSSATCDLCGSLSSSSWRTEAPDPGSGQCSRKGAIRLPPPRNQPNPDRKSRVPMGSVGDKGAFFRRVFLSMVLIADPCSSQLCLPAQGWFSSVKAWSVRRSSGTLVSIASQRIMSLIAK